VKFDKTVPYISFPARQLILKIDTVPNILYLRGKLISANIFRIYWPINVEFAIEDLRVTPLCDCKFCESQYSESCTLLTDVHKSLPLLCEVFFLILTKYDILKCINFMTIDLVEIDVVKSILYLRV
jgi:hypothetical protein